MMARQFCTYIGFIMVVFVGLLAVLSSVACISNVAVEEGPALPTPRPTPRPIVAAAAVSRLTDASGWIVMLRYHDLQAHVTCWAPSGGDGFSCVPDWQMEDRAP